MICCFWQKTGLCKYTTFHMHQTLYPAIFSCFLNWKFIFRVCINPTLPLWMWHFLSRVQQVWIQSFFLLDGLPYQGYKVQSTFYISRVRFENIKKCDGIVSSHIKENCFGKVFKINVLNAKKTVLNQVNVSLIVHFCFCK